MLGQTSGTPTDYNLEWRRANNLVEQKEWRMGLCLALKKVAKLVS